jgi:membrane protein DedA with SNARE-associated domain
VSTAETALLSLFIAALIPLVPTEPVLVGMGVLAASGKVGLLPVIAVAAVACSISDHLLYGFGRFTGGRMLARLNGKPSVGAAADWLRRHVARWGAPILVVGRWLPGGGTIGAVLTGTLHWPLLRFTPASLAGSALWSSYVGLLGYFGGSLTGQPLVGLLVSLAVATGVGLLISLVVQRSERQRRTSAAGDDDADSADPIEDSFVTG